MFPSSLRTLTWQIVKNSPFNFNILWSKQNYILIELSQKPTWIKNNNEDDTIPDYDLDVNPHLNNINKIVKNANPYLYEDSSSSDVLPDRKEYHAEDTAEFDKYLNHFSPLKKSKTYQPDPPLINRNTSSLWEKYL